MSSHGHGHHHHHGADFDWEAMADKLEVDGTFVLPLVAAVVDDLAAAGLDPDRVGHVIDVGCGPGVVTCALARHFPSAHVTGLDSAGELLARLRARAAEAGLDGRVARLRGRPRARPATARSGRSRVGVDGRAPRGRSRRHAAPARRLAAARRHPRPGRVRRQPARPARRRPARRRRDMAAARGCGDGLARRRGSAPTGSAATGPPSSPLPG